MCVTKIAAAIGLFCLLLLPTGAEGQKSSPPNASQGSVSMDKVRLYIPEQSTPDRYRAVLYRATAKAVPVEKWPTVTVDQETTIPQLVSHYFQIYSGSTPNAYGANPRTSEELDKLIRDANGLSSDVVNPTAVLKLPPVPVRGFTKYAEGVWMREFDPELQQYSLMVDAGGRQSSKTQAVAPATELRAWRAGKITAIVVQMDATIKAEIGKLVGYAIPTSDDGFDVLHLLDDGSSDCHEGTSWLSSSPYFPILQSKIASLDKAALVAAGAQQHLVIIDWDFQSPNSHGNKVLSVVKQVLTQLQLGSLIPDIETVDLHPKAGEAALRSTLNAYEQSFAATPEWHGQDLSRVFEDAFKWLGREPDSSDSQQQKVPSLALQAVFWKYFSKRHVVNVSFTIESTAFGVANPRFMTGTKSFGVLAAGNSGLELSTVDLPQAEASSWPSLLNVTHGKQDGTILGDYTNDRYPGRIVNLIAPGCGYQFGAIAPADVGSSFASPYVAVAAWLLSLTDASLPVDSTPRANEIKRRLVLAAIAAPPNADRVQSGGVFDFARLFGQSATHYLDTQGHIVPLSSGSLTVHYRSAGTDSTNTFSITSAMDGKSLVLFDCENGQVCLSYRQWRKGSTGPDPAIEAPVSSLEFSAVTAGGEQLSCSSPSEFRQKVKQINF